MKKGYSHYYKLLNFHAKRDGWTRCGVKLEDDLYEEGIDWLYDEDEILKIIKLVLKTPYLNRLKQFYFRLIRNKLFLVSEAKNALCVVNIRRGVCHSCTSVRW